VGVGASGTTSASVNRKDALAGWIKLRHHATQERVRDSAVN
jgi:hypothetical protein